MLKRKASSLGSTPVKKARPMATTCAAETALFLAPELDLDAYVYPALKAKTKVLIWDLDETLLLFSSLCNGAYAKRVGKTMDASMALGESMMCFVFTVLEKHLFFDELEKEDIEHVSHITRYDDGASLEKYDFTADAIAADAVGSADRLRKLAYRYRRIRQIYERLEDVAFLTRGTPEADFCADLRASIDAFGDGWGRTAQRALAAATQRGYKNIVVTNTQLVPALCKCLIYDLDQYFPPDMIYSSSHIRKKHCFETIQAQYGHDEYEFIGIGDGPEEESASSACAMPFVKARRRHFAASTHGTSIQDLNALADMIEQDTLDFSAA
ncbi:eyes absent-like 1 isoform 4 [Achlya hypogyna]|uniref:protein-tyrosine-phosphatase n=1 Tax=Achlya hypogyna TaxID=1202772 RepID=A0A1V9ZND4_ACHHY|nr:eyes absent-like 1 isoform 4 [Achlya hypogyna]